MTADLPYRPATDWQGTSSSHRNRTAGETAVDRATKPMIVADPAIGREMKSILADSTVGWVTNPVCRRSTQMNYDRLQSVNCIGSRPWSTAAKAPKHTQSNNGCKLKFR